MLSYSAQKVLIKLISQDRVTAEKQGVYISKNNFYTSMSHLRKGGFILPIRNEMGYMDYVLTKKGILLAELLKELKS